MELLDLIIIAAATYRITNLLVADAGPWRVFARLRECVGASADACANSVMQHGHATNVFCCQHCAGLWVAGAVLLAWFIFPAVVYLFAVAGLASIAHSLAQ